MLKIKLYPCFRHLLKFNNIWLYSDPHFNDAEMAQLRKGYVDAEQVKNINSKVGKNDCLIILGDIGDTSFVEQLRGYKILVKGNHDAGASNYQKTEDNNLFDEVYEGPVCIAEKIILSHEPLNMNYMLNIHGHTHSKHNTPNDICHYCVCAEQIDYTPVSLISIFKDGRLSKIESIHRQTINAATALK